MGGTLGGAHVVNPSPNAPNIWIGRAELSRGLVILEATTLSEGRGPPGVGACRRSGSGCGALLAEMHSLATPWRSGWPASGPDGRSLTCHKARRRPLARGVKVACEDAEYYDHEKGFQTLEKCSRSCQGSEETAAGLRRFGPGLSPYESEKDRPARCDQRKGDSA